MRRQALLAWALAAAGAAQADPQTERAWSAYERGNYAEAHGQLLAAAEKGDANAQELVGFMYAFGAHLYPGVQRDLDAAMAWFQRAAQSGRPAARYMHCALERRQAVRRPAVLDCFQRDSGTQTAARGR